METSSEKEERKRKNAEKGLNRMSQIRSARPQSQEHHPTPSSTDVKKGSFDARDRKVFFTDDDHQSPETNQSHDISAAPVGLSEASTSSTLKQGGMPEISSANTRDIGSQAEILSKGTDKHKTSARAVGESQPETSSKRKASTNTESIQKTSRNQANLYSSKLLNSCIIASVTTRGLCALLIAFCVLLSHINFPLLGLSIGTVDSNVSSKPFYIILLTDFTIVLSRLFLGRKGVSLEVEEEKPAACQDDKKNWDATVMLLERGLVAYRTIQALFTDFSIYAVVVICGTSLLLTFSFFFCCCC
ncbi:uncharacterized protein LOC120193174 [Hibiscus syriacus]|uniref:uncharacterized protein LOC120193174 n=1 Tax=Hibiscus syriacus TaxID=106335 RepID=UPI0019213025|nr:uncharacterized protein LOC120193174 [Hibiscus syriacus]